MKMLRGVSAASGICAGTVCQYMSDIESSIPHYSIKSQRIASEIKRLEDALAVSRKGMEEVIKNAESVYDKQMAEIFNVHLMILNDKTLSDKMSQLIRQRKLNAEHAVKDVFDEYITKYQKKDEHFYELTHDYVDLRNQILSALNIKTGQFACSTGENEAIIVAAKRLTPSLVTSIPADHVLAFIAEEGGFTSHATILARSYGVPIILGIPMSELACGERAVVDGSLGKVFVSPDEKIERYYAKKLKKMQQRKSVCAVRKAEPVSTGSKQPVSLKINISTPAELNLMKGLHYDGIGLLRTEFLFLQRETAPTEEEQYRMYTDVLSENPKHPVTIRLLDIGADKLPPYITSPAGVAIDLGLRGALAVEQFKQLYLTQMRALLRANVYGNLRLLYPMVSDVPDLSIYRSIVKEARRQLRAEKIAYSRKPFKEGVMIETPAAVMLVKELVEEVDFINIGSNDLLQYALAASRGNLLVEEHYHIMHPALIEMMKVIMKEGNKAGKEVCLCGEIASFEEYYPLLLNIGLRSFSVSVGKYEDIKCFLLHINTTDYKKAGVDFTKVKSKKDADAYFQRFV